MSVGTASPALTPRGGLKRNAARPSLRREMIDLWSAHSSHTFMTGRRGAACHSPYRAISWAAGSRRCDYCRSRKLWSPARYFRRRSPG